MVFLIDTFDFARSLLQGFSVLATVPIALALLVGAFLGILVGVLPGVGPGLARGSPLRCFYPLPMACHHWPASLCCWVFTVARSMVGR